MEQPQQRTLYVGLIISLALYGVSFVIPVLYEGPVGQWASIVLILIALAFMVIWMIAVRRGFRLGRQGRQERRLKDREKKRPAHTKLR
ncbi:MAG TPA: hypothetical protein VHH36_06700 [Candidatus Thermoplasmatota archaeon]|nr:hypothetical protein [Candidatus Thermoplasmatota archaeon]